MEFGFEFKRDSSAISDPRIGSSQDNSTGSSSVPKGVTSGSNSPSISTLFVTLVPILIFTVVCLLIFLVVRRKYPRVYSPRTLLSSLAIHERSIELPSGWFNWIKPCWRVPDDYILNHSSIDGFLFLRYIKIVSVICLVGCCMTWPILLPLHAYGGGGLSQLDSITFRNVANPKLMYVHACVAFAFFGFILYMVSRECMYFINVRQAYLLSPYYSSRLSARTVLFTCVPQEYRDESKLRRIFGPSVEKIWIPRDSQELDRLVKEREQTALRLEKAEILLIKKANLARRRAVQNGHPDIQVAPAIGPDIQVAAATISADEQSKAPNATVDIPSSPQSHFSGACSPASGSDGLQKSFYGPDGPPFDINGSFASQWIPHSSRPVHRPLANYGRRVDTIKWTRRRLKELRPRIRKLQRRQRTGYGPPIPAVFIEFDSQLNAQSAFQTLSHHRAFHMSVRLIGVQPYEIVWSSLRMTWWERIIRRLFVQASIGVMIVFWAIPCAIVGIISNLPALANLVSFLNWINSLPQIILGLLSGLVPVIALSLLMAAVPGFMRKFARIAGVATLSQIELFSQHAYFAFQVIQVFLITTMSSAASAALAKIIADPMSALVLLPQSLPGASNFYLSYFIMQCLAFSVTRLLSPFSLIRFIASQGSTKSPRLIFKNWHKLRMVHWGSIFPVYTNLVVIAISYSLMAPVVLGFATIGFYCVYLGYRYNLIYVYDSEIDTKGLVYPRALKQMLTGLYLAQACMIGLFSSAGAYVPMVLMVILVVITFLVQSSLSDALDPLLYNLPKTLAAEEADRHLSIDEDAQDKYNLAPGNGDLPEDDGFESDSSNSPEMIQTGIRAVEGADGAVSFLANTLISAISSKIRSRFDVDGTVNRIDFWTRWISPDPNSKPNFLVKWLHPEIFSDYKVLRERIPSDLPNPRYPDDALRDAYYPPSVRLPPPSLWIPRDQAEVSRQEVAHSGKVVKITDEGADLDEKNRITVDLDSDCPVLIDRTRY